MYSTLNPCLVFCSSLSSETAANTPNTSLYQRLELAPDITMQIKRFGFGIHKDQGHAQSRIATIIDPVDRGSGASPSNYPVSENRTTQ
jgi:hypothetical protein